ncbi:PREDICTED: uncharacterized protein LOC104763561 [Camelina sativa]|uniref:Uncharacterized protein LOC104763561 n=1 Tax=Camelina sativa TaxID=90675 RepID=A0ABM0XFH5_CAMSA|nr:PREDICTED: uncharacterized protein LOC104763561 [Camelina sativa]
MRKWGLLTLVGVLMITNCVIARRRLSQQENLELELQLKLLNKPALKTVKTEHGDVYDCVDFYKQPAFDNPLLKDHDFHFDMKPNHEIQRLTTRESKDLSSDKIKAFEFKGVGCPHGTVPIKRTTKEDLMRLRNSTASILHPQTDADEPGLHFAGAQVNNRKLDNMKLGGGEAYFSLYQTPDVGQLQFSSGLIKVAAGDDFIKAGWTVNPTLYGDNRCRLFVYLKTKNERCFNTNCPGFVVKNSEIPLGHVFKVSKPNEIMENRFYIFRDIASGNWWLRLGDMDVGFWPIQTLVGLGDTATDIYWEGDVFSVPNSKSCPMGNGKTMTGPYPKLYAYARGVSVLDENKGTLESVDDRNDLVSDIGMRYVLQSLDGWGKTIFFGGPSGVFGK